MLGRGRITKTPASVSGALLIAVLALAPFGQAAQAQAVQGLQIAVEQCFDMLNGDVTLAAETEVIQTPGGLITLIFKNVGLASEQCTIADAAPEGEPATVGWPSGAEIAKGLTAKSDELRAANLDGWPTPVVPVLACGEASLIAQSLRVLMPGAPSRDAPPEVHPIEINMPAPQALCDKYGSLDLIGGTYYA